MMRYFGDPNEYYTPPAYHGNAKYDGRFDAPYLRCHLAVDLANTSDFQTSGTLLSKAFVNFGRGQLGVEFQFNDFVLTHDPESEGQGESRAGRVRRLQACRDGAGGENRDELPAGVPAGQRRRRGGGRSRERHGPALRRSARSSCSVSPWMASVTSPPRPRCSRSRGRSRTDRCA